MRRQALQRKSTRGPLDEEDPLSNQPVSNSTHDEVKSRGGTSSHRSSGSFHKSPIHSPALSQTSLHRSRPSSRQSEVGYLTRQENFQTLDKSGIPESFRADEPITEVNAEALQQALNRGRYYVAADIAVQLLTGYVTPAIADVPEILRLYYVRLASLVILRHTREAAWEARPLVDINSNAVYRKGGSGLHLAPWALRLLIPRLLAVGTGEWRRCIMGLYDLAGECRWWIGKCRGAHRAGETANRGGDVSLSQDEDDDEELWKKRLQEVSLRVADALVEMGDLVAATRFLQQSSTEGSPTPLVQERLAMIYLRLGNVSAARRCIEAISEGDDTATLEALVSAAEGEWDAAVSQWQAIADQPDISRPTRELALQNRALCLVYAGRVSEVRSELETLLDEPNSLLLHATTFNLSTTYELTSEKARTLKLDLADKVAERLRKRAEDGANEDEEVLAALPRDRLNADFKL